MEEGYQRFGMQFQRKPRVLSEEEQHFRANFLENFKGHGWSPDELLVRMEDGYASWLRHGKYVHPDDSYRMQFPRKTRVLSQHEEDFRADFLRRFKGHGWSPGELLLRMEDDYASWLRHGKYVHSVDSDTDTVGPKWNIYFPPGEGPNEER